MRTASGKHGAGGQAPGSQHAMARHVDEHPVVGFDRPVKPHGVIETGAHVPRGPVFLPNAAPRMRGCNRGHRIEVR